MAREEGDGRGVVREDEDRGGGGAPGGRGGQGGDGGEAGEGGEAGAAYDGDADGVWGERGLVFGGGGGGEGAGLRS